MDGIEGWVPALGPSGWQGGEVFSEVQRWNREEAVGQMKTPFVRFGKCHFCVASEAVIWYNHDVKKTETAHVAET